MKNNVSKISTRNSEHENKQDAIEIGSFYFTRDTADEL